MVQPEVGVKEALKPHHARVRIRILVFEQKSNSSTTKEDSEVDRNAVLVTSTTTTLERYLHMTVNSKFKTLISESKSVSYLSDINYLAVN